MLSNALRKTTSRVVTIARFSSSTSGGSARNMQKLFIDYLDEHNNAAAPRRNVSSTAPATKGEAPPANAPTTKDEAEEKKPKMQKLGIDYLKEAEKKVAEKSGPVEK